MTISCPLFNDTLPTFEKVLKRISKDPSLRLGPSIDVFLKAEKVWTSQANHVVRLKVEGLCTGNPIYVKFPRGEQGLDLEFSRSKLLRIFFESVRHEFDSAEVVAYYKEPEALVIKECPGRSLHDKIYASCSWFGRSPLKECLESTTSVGRWLRYLESISTHELTSEIVWKEYALQAVNAREKIAETGAITNANYLADNCMNVILKAAERAVPEAVYYAHGDFHPANFIITNGPSRRVVAIDCRLSGPKFIGYDALMFDYQLSLSFGPHRYRPWCINRTIGSFYEGYSRTNEPHIDVVNSTVALIVLYGLRYISSTSKSNSPSRNIYNYLNYRSINNWYNRMSINK